MMHLMSIPSASGRTRRGEGVKDLVAQFEPSAQLLRRAVDRTRPATASEGSLDFGGGRILSQK
jgi:hypothetical protein